MPDFLIKIFAPAQIFGYIGMACALLSYQCKKNRNYFFMQTACATAFTLQYLLLGSWAAMLLNVVAIVRGVLFSLGDKCHKTFVHVLLQASFVGTALLSVLVFREIWWIALCVFVAQSGGTLSQWTRNGKTIRMTQLLVVSPLWLVNNIYYMAIGGIFCECFNIISVLVSILRFRKSGFDKN